MNYCNYLAAALLLVALGSNQAAAVQYRLLHSFEGGANDGGFPESSLTLGGATLYGTTSGGGGVFKLNTDGTGYQLLHSFAGGANDGSAPDGSLRLSGSTLYGVTGNGGASNRGTVFSLNTDGTGFQLLNSFGGGSNDGSSPTDLVLTGSTLYVATYGSGDGTVFKLNTDGSFLQLLYRFSITRDKASYPLHLTLGGPTLYGTTQDSANHRGTVFKLNTDGTGFQLLHSFAVSSNDGRHPEGDLALIGSTLYGTASLGGIANAAGTVFKVNTDGTGYQTLHSFRQGTYDGAYPNGGLSLNGSTLYGTTRYGGAASHGTVFKIKADGTGFRLLHSFLGGANDGEAPYAGVTFDGSTLYGTTDKGGPNDQGTVFAITLTDEFAKTFFSEPPPGVANYTPGVGDEELGFVTTQSPTGGLNPFVGVGNVARDPILTHQSVHATTTFDPVDLSNWTDVEVSLDLQVSNTTFETGDFVHVYATNGNQNIDLFNQLGTGSTDELDRLAGDGFATFTAAIPADWNTAQLVIESSSNSTTTVEESYDFDYIAFNGLRVVVSEPSSLVLAIIGVAAVGWIGSRFHPTFIHQL